jgi:hypothetical protein
MTQDEIAQAMQDTAGNSWGTESHFQRFAALVAAAERELVLAAAIDGAEHAARKAVIDEREACAKVADEADKYNRHISREIAGAIRARGQA